MTRREFAKVLFQHGIFSSKLEADRNIEIIFQLIEKAIIEDGFFSIRHFGKIELVERAPRMGRNPKTGEEINIDARKSIKFRPSRFLLERLWEEK